MVFAVISFIQTTLREAPGTDPRPSLEQRGLAGSYDFRVTETTPAWESRIRPVIAPPSEPSRPLPGLPDPVRIEAAVLTNGSQPWAGLKYASARFGRFERLMSCAEAYDPHRMRGDASSRLSCTGVFFRAARWNPRLRCRFRPSSRSEIGAGEPVGQRSGHSAWRTGNGRSWTNLIRQRHAPEPSDHRLWRGMHGSGGL